MLILTRRVGESLMIGDQVAVTVLGVKGNQVRIGVRAPKEVSVHREEIYQRIQAEISGEAPPLEGGKPTTTAEASGAPKASPAKKTEKAPDKASGKVQEAKPEPKATSNVA